MENRISVRVSQWYGLNTRDSDLEIDEGESPSLENIEFFQQGWKTRNGIDALTANHIGAGTKEVTSIFDGFNNIYLTEGTNVRKWNAGASTFDTFGVAPSITDGTIPAWASYKGLDLFVNGSGGDNPLTFGSIGDYMGGSPPKADDICVWRNHVFMAGLASPNQDEVRFSDMENPESWPSTRFLRPSKQAKGSNLIACKVVPYPGELDGTRLGIFAADNIYQFNGFSQSTFQVFHVQHGLGAVSRRGIVVAEGLVFWVAQNGIYCSPDGGQTVNLISWNIQPTFDALNQSRLQYSVGVHFRNKRQVAWTFSDGSSTYHNKILVYNYGLSTPMTPAGSEGARHVWSVYTGLTINCMAEILDSTAGYVVWGGESYPTGNLTQAYLMDTGTNDNGTAIAWKLKTKRFLLTEWNAYHILRLLSVVHDAQSAQALVKLYIDSSRVPAAQDALELSGGGVVFGGGVFGADTWGGSTARSSRLWYNRVAQAVQFEFSGATLDKLLRCYEVAFSVRPGRLR